MAWVAIIGGVGLGLLILPFVLSMTLDLARAWYDVVTKELPDQFRRRR